MKRSFVAAAAIDILHGISGDDSFEPTARSYPSGTPPNEWPSPLSTEAFYGLAGDFIKVVGPETEADDAALLYQLLTVFGCHAGRGSYFQIGGDRHYPNLFVVITAQSSKGRKGTGLGEVKRLYSKADSDWITQRQVSGLSTGEGLLWSVRDPIIENVPVKNGKQVVDHRQEVTDLGVADKRLLVVESEFAQPLQAASRDGNTLSALIRLAWDGSVLRVLAKSAKAVCLEPHIAIIAHITIAELTKLLTSTDSLNGFANRFLWVCSARSKCLPFGGSVDLKALESIAEGLKRAARFAHEAGRMDFSVEARTAWAAVYPELSEGRPGLLGAVTARAEAQALRLAMIYALLDCSSTIELPHLRAALAAWQYVEDSARFIFGDSLGNATADEILRLLRDNPAGLSRNQISEHFQRHKSSGELTLALSTLHGCGLAKSTSRKTAGRPVEIWLAIGVGATHE